MHGDVAAAQEFLAKFDQMFAVMEDNDGGKAASAGLWPRRTGGLS